MMQRFHFIYALLLVFAVGCGGDSSSSTPPTKPVAQPNAQAQKAAAPVKSVAPPVEAAPDPEPVAKPADEKKPLIGPNETAQKADVGATGKGQYQPGIITTPISAYFASKEMTVFRIEIPKAMQLYQAEKEHFPRTQEEFMSDIIKANNITLPKLPEGHRYVYDPQTGELLVAQPK